MRNIIMENSMIPAPGIMRVMKSRGAEIDKVYNGMDFMGDSALSEMLKDLTSQKNIIYFESTMMQRDFIEELLEIIHESVVEVHAYLHTDHPERTRDYFAEKYPEVSFNIITFKEWDAVQYNSEFAYIPEKDYMPKLYNEVK